MAPGLSWMYNSNTGVVAELPTIPAEGLMRTGLGWHGLFDTKQQAIDYYNRNKAANPGWKVPIGVTDVGKAVSNAGDSAKQDVLGTFKGVNLEVWVLRIAEIVLGIVLIGVGLAKLTGAGNAISKLAKVAIP